MSSNLQASLKRLKRCAKKVCSSRIFRNPAAKNACGVARTSSSAPRPAGAVQAHGDVMDPALASLIEDLAESGMLKKTLVIMLSEFGRTPRINMNAGRDHWASCFSCFIAGGGIKGGTVVGSSDKGGYQPKDRPVRVPDVHATLCHAMGIDPDTQVQTPLQRPMKLVDNGKSVGELFG